MQQNAQNIRTLRMATKVHWLITILLKPHHRYSHGSIICGASFNTHSVNPRSHWNLPKTEVHYIAGITIEEL